MATVLNLFDVQKAKSAKGDEYGAAVVELFIQECDIAPMLSWKTLGTVEVRHRRTNSIPTVGFRQGRGASFGGINGVNYDSVSDAVWSMGAQIDIDKTDYRDSEAPNILEERTRLAVKGMTWTFNEYFVNGDHGTDPYGFEGIAARLANMPSGQVIYGDTSSAELDVRPAASPSEYDLYQFLDRIDAAIDELDGHEGDIALTSSDFMATLRSVLRRLNKYTVRTESNPNNFGTVGRRSSAIKNQKSVLTYPEEKGIKWYDMGFKADQSTRIIGTETVNSVACRPVYFLKLGSPAYVHGIQQYPMEVDPPKKLDDNLTYRVTIDWPLGLHHTHNKSISKLSGVRVA